MAGREEDRRGKVEKDEIHSYDSSEYDGRERPGLMRQRSNFPSCTANTPCMSQRQSGSHRCCVFLLDVLSVCSDCCLFQHGSCVNQVNNALFWQAGIGDSGNNGSDSEENDEIVQPIFAWQRHISKSYLTCLKKDYMLY